MALSTPRNSTNVRNESPLDPWPRAQAASRAPLVVLGAWTVFVILAGIQGVFAQLEAEAYFGLAALVLAVSLVAAWVDDEVGALLAEVDRALPFALVLDALLVVGASAIVRSGEWSALPGAVLFLVVLPVTLVLNAEALRRPRLRKAPGASPGARRAAT
jgi:hypothetical protein